MRRTSTAFAPQASPRLGRDETWPALPYAEWKPTYDTLHMWMQIVGKVKLELTPLLNDWWNVAFTVGPRGLTSSTIPFGRGAFEADFDFIDHQLTINTSDGRSRRMQLVARPVADFFQEFMSHLEALDIHVEINTRPVEVDNPIRFENDRVHAAYESGYVERWWRILLSISSVMDLSAELAERYGYINRALPAAELTPFVENLAHRIASFPEHAIAHAKAAVDTGAFGSLAEGLLAEAHESDLSVASEVTQARVMEELKLGAETYASELEMDYLSRLSPQR